MPNADVDPTLRTGPRPHAAAAAVLLLALAPLPLPGPLPADGAGARAQEDARLNVVTTLPTYADIARFVAGDRARVEAIARGDEDPHFVTPRPSFARKIARADVFVTTGLDLEVWVPGLLDRANNARVLEGADGHVVAHSGVELLQVPENVSRSEGDVHVFGNPHVHTDPINAVLIARNVRDGLKRVDPGGAQGYDERTRVFRDSILKRTFGAGLVEMVGADALFDLARAGEFWSFARDQRVEGKPLAGHVGGWLGRAAPFRGRRMACYHKNWAYFSARFDVDCAIYVEPKPGVPPSPGHVGKVIRFMESEEIPVLFSANYFSEDQVRKVADRVGAEAVWVPEHVGGGQGADDYFALIDLWVSRLAEAFGAEDRP
jgi:ABC-type Zn uptake system ZnuABC Zn-binding protein ZnuA